MSCTSREVPLIHPGTILRLSVFFGTDAQSWGNLQTRYDTEHARVAMADVLGRIVRRELADDHHETPNARAKLAPTAW